MDKYTEIKMKAEIAKVIGRYVGDGRTKVSVNINIVNNPPEIIPGRIIVIKMLDCNLDDCLLVLEEKHNLTKCRNFSIKKMTFEDSHANPRHGLINDILFHKDENNVFIGKDGTRIKFYEEFEHFEEAVNYLENVNCTY